MLGITDQMEAALAYVIVRGKGNAFDDSLMPSEAFIELRDAGLLNMQTDWSQSLVLISGITPEGKAHYQEVINKRRQFESVSETADELLGAIVANEGYRKRGRAEALFDEDLSREEDFRQLSKAELLDVFWADDVAYSYSVTDKGLSYIRGYFVDQIGQPIVNVNQYNSNNAYGGQSESLASASSNNTINLSIVIKSINASEIDNDAKAEASQAVAELQEASAEKNVDKFAEALEKVASIAKNTTTLATTLLPYAGQLIGQMFS